MRTAGMVTQGLNGLEDATEETPEYEAATEGLFWNKRTADGTPPVRLTNFTVASWGGVLGPDGHRRRLRRAILAISLC